MTAVYDFEKKVRELRDFARKQGNRKGTKHCAELPFWGTATKELTAVIRELREQRQMMDDDRS